MSFRIALLLSGSITISVFAQNFDPPPPKSPDADTLKLIAEKKVALDKVVADAVKQLPAIHQPDLLIYPKAVEWITRHREYYTADIGKQILAVIDQGMKRAAAASDGKPMWLDAVGKSVARAYRSRVDGSVQPYAVWYPADYGKEKKLWRIDVMLHGRDGSLTEVKFLNGHAGRATPKDAGYVQLDIYGRGNNAYRWAGEEDVFEALKHFLATETSAGRRHLVSQDFVVLKGFSMGGAGTWQIGLRHPSRFVALQPGAGFTSTHGYIAGLPEKLPSPAEEMLTIYDAVNYARNAVNVPVVAYSGEIDKQRQAAVNIEDRLKELGLSKHMTHLIGPGLEHKFPPEWQRAAEAKLGDLALKPRPAMPARVDFVTHTLRNAGVDWLQITGMTRQYAPVTVTGTWDGKTFRVTTANVSRLTLVNFDNTELHFPAKVTLDGQDVDCEKGQDKDSISRDFIRDGTAWRLATAEDDKGLRKRTNVQGPIDDAFTRPFVCVVGTGTPANPAMHAASLAQLDRLKKEWDKWFRGELRVVKDTDFKNNLLGNESPILFGDPSSNSVTAELLPKLPITWTAKELVVNGVAYPAESHLPMMVFPHPTKGGGYVVINSGHTFHEAEFKGTNAQLYPRLGDFAVVKPTPTAKEPAAFVVIDNGLFDEFWKFPKK